MQRIELKIKVDLKLINILWPKIYLPLIAFIYSINLFAKDIQEDSWITFRTAFNIADHGQWSYNLGDSYSSTTSFFYPLFVSALRFLFGSFTIQAILVINSLVVLLTVRLFVQILSSSLPMSRNLQNLVFFLLAVQPVSLLLAGKGMETIYLIFLLLVSIKFLQQSCYSKSIFFSSLAIFIRPDAFIYTVSLGFYIFFRKKNYRKAFILVHFLVYSAYLCSNKFFTGDWLPATISAKRISYYDSFVMKLVNLFASPQIETFAPLTTKFVPDWIYKIYFVFAILSVVFLLLNLKGWKLKHSYTMVILSYCSIIPIFVYSLTNSVFPWYTWPSRFIFQSVLIYILIYFITRRQFKFFVISCIVFSSFVQLAISVNTGVRYEYRISIGEYIQNNSLATDVLVLEPAGQIPFYSRLKTIDTVGLTNPAAIEYQVKYGSLYLENMLIDLQPEWVVFPSPIIEVIPGLENFPTLSNYVLAKHFRYEPENFSKGLVLEIAKFGTLQDDMFLYKLK